MTKTADLMAAEHVRYQRDWDEATAKHTVYGEERSLDRSVQYVEASAGTGSRYVVVLSKLGEAATKASGGGNLLVSVLYPRQAAYAIYVTGPADVPGDDYLIEKFCRGLSHGGDHAALCLTIREAVRLMWEEPDPERVRQIATGRWEIRGYDVVEEGRSYFIWRSGKLVADADGMKEVREYIDAHPVAS